MILDITFHQFIDNILTMADKVYYLITHSIIPFMVSNYFFRLILILIVLSFIVVLFFDLLDISTSGIFNYSEEYSPHHGPRHTSGYLNSVGPVADDDPIYDFNSSYNNKDINSITVSSTDMYRGHNLD